MSVSTMNEIGFFLYYESDHFKVLELPYIHPKENLPDLAFLILLPNEHFGLKDLKKEMNAENLKNILANLESEEVNIFLPKFTFTKSFSLKNVLTKMGMGLAFGADADFEGINGSKDLKIGQVLHKAFIAIDETGTEASAATAVSMNMKAVLNQKEPILFRIDHPFMFIIYEKLTGSILFCGQVVNPLALS